MGSGSKTVHKTETLKAPEPLPSHSAASVSPTPRQQSRIEGSAASVQLLGDDETENIRKTTNLIG